MYLYDYESAFEMWQRNNNIFDKKKKKRRFKNSSDKFSKKATSAFCEILSIEIILKGIPAIQSFPLNEKNIPEHMILRKDSKFK